MSTEIQPKKKETDDKLLENVHRSLTQSGFSGTSVKGNYLFYHYGVGNYNDRGWGCGYRTLQSLCSWVKNQLDQVKKDRKPTEVPSIPDIQDALVAMGDKDPGFKGSRNWIGSFEVCLCLDYFYNMSCKIMHLHSGQDLSSHIQELVQHFQTFGSPVMMGGDQDSSSKGILGVCTSPAALLVMDPHYYRTEEPVSAENLIEQGWIKWKPLEEFDKDSFYNLCLPQLKAQELS